jgi:2-keto-4-pentenoate hydratase/2-oxohepta-3-ene-1,7-dioic acid hydratase in catechol pathway
MRFVRYQYGKDNPCYGWILDDKVGPVEGTPFGGYRRMTASLPLESVNLLAPVEPSKIICVGRNYVEHARETGSEVPQTPLIFLKPPSSVIGPGEKIVLPPQSQLVEHEGELAVIIGKPGRWISIEDATGYIFGYTVANDVTARDLQRRDGQWTRAKGFDTFCPLGPWIETELEPADTLITCRVNSEMRQMASSREMVFNIPQLIAYASSVMKLLPGDIILTGTPAGVGPLNDGDTVEVTIEGIGTLSNPVRKEKRTI